MVGGRASGACRLLVLDDRRLVGAATAMALTEADPEFRRVLSAAGLAPQTVCYFGESVLLPDWRGQDIGHRFFDEREAFAREQGFAVSAFCAVQRPADHPARPANYRPLDAFWRGRGYEELPNVRASYDWLDMNEAQSTHKPMQFWSKVL